MLQSASSRFADAAGLEAHLLKSGSVPISPAFLPEYAGVVLELRLVRQAPPLSPFGLRVDYTSWVLQAWGELNYRFDYEFATVVDALAMLRRRFGLEIGDIPLPFDRGKVDEIDVFHPEEGDYADAWTRLSDHLESILRREAEELGDADAGERLARLLVNRGRADEAARIRLRWLLTTSLPSDLEGRIRALRDRADQRFLARLFDEASEDYEALSALEPNDASHPARRIECLLRAKRYPAVLEAASAQADRLESAPAEELHDLRLGAAFRYRGEAKYWLGDKAGAEADYRRAIGANPGSAQARADLAEVLLERGEIDAAEECAEQAQELGMTGGLAQLVLGDVHSARGDLTEARRWWQAADCSEAAARLEAAGGPPGESPTT